jgi:hypothetical protein
MMQKGYFTLKWRNLPRNPISIAWFARFAAALSLARVLFSTVSHILNN